MGEPNNPCFKPQSPYATWTTSLSSTTTLSPTVDFFILPISGIPCPVISFDETQDEPIEKNIFTCSSQLYDPNPCILEVDKYLRVADLDININRCNRYKLLISNIITPTTTTSSTTSTSTTSTTSTTISPFGCNTLRYAFGVTNVVQYGSYAIGTVTASNIIRSIWGNNSYGYTDDSSWNRAVIHAGLLSVGQTAQIKFNFLGNKNNFPGSLSNGVLSSPWNGNWCAISLELA